MQGRKCGGEGEGSGATVIMAATAVAEVAAAAATATAMEAKALFVVADGGWGLWRQAKNSACGQGFIHSGEDRPNQGYEYLRKVRKSDACGQALRIGVEGIEL